MCRTRVVASRHRPTFRNYKLHIAVGKTLLGAATRARYSVALCRWFNTVYRQWCV